MATNNNEVVVDEIHMAINNDESADTERSNLSENLVEESFGNDSDEEMVDSDKIRDTAKLLLRKLPSKFLLQYEDDMFLLFDYDENDDDNESQENDNDSQNSYPIICEDIDACHESFKHLLIVIRKFIQGYYNGVTLGAKEIVISIPILDLIIYEDNMYNDQVSFNDLETIFQTLRKRSLIEKEDNIPKYLSGVITTRPRFVSRYNTLVELTEGSATLKNIKPFFNDEDNPVVLDDEDEQPEGSKNEKDNNDGIAILDD
ncbi:similar to Saccharomyces cerevisiae YGL250W RMR1 Protein required for meiotic recombination and gene conversion [Maudiozyma saulgeensis]|uniref:Similar to Saccharomyces cerevisiae YGL250W RMR1 Protein required for meiotic recombination and gene conversion n=1 Tax=Maudiozyma saulgeensis TaxID=1789683 RepID=A0A1X7QYG6_9SACH|nr:similar to Saccharomyces cerevisiae YGL250W RMR1 Protein required for meiotic recombination and gene conversion [Kazachstania saulgeensis]